MMKTEKIDKIREDLYKHIHSHNKVLNREYLASLDIEALLCNTHPLYREWYEKLIKPLINENTKVARDNQ